MSTATGRCPCSGQVSWEACSSRSRRRSRDPGPRSFMVTVMVFGTVDVIGRVRPCLVKSLLSVVGCQLSVRFRPGQPTTGCELACGAVFARLGFVGLEGLAVDLA